MDFAVGEENENFTDQTSWPPELEGQSTTRSLADPVSLSPEPEGQSTTQRTTSDFSVGSPSTKSCDVDDVTTVDALTHSNEHTVLRRSQRERRPVDRLSYDKFFNISWYYKGGVNVMKITVWNYVSCAHTMRISFSLIAF